MLIAILTQGYLSIIRITTNLDYVQDDFSVDLIEHIKTFEGEGIRFDGNNG